MPNRKTHMAFTDAPWTYCGKYLGNGGLNTFDWSKVTCRKCQSKKPRQVMKRKTLDQKAAAKYVEKEYGVHRDEIDFDYSYADAFLAGVKYGRRTAIEAINKKDILNDPHNAASKSEFWKGVLGGKTWAIDAIKKRGKR